VVENGIYFADQNGSSGSGSILFYDFASRNVRLVSRVDKPFMVADSAFAVSPDRRTILYTQIDQSGSDIYILDRPR
jgi:Tol biopolymer transport system component